MFRPIRARGKNHPLYSLLLYYVKAFFPLRSYTEEWEWQQVPTAGSFHPASSSHHIFLTVLERKFLRRIFGPKRNDQTGEYEIRSNNEIKKSSGGRGRHKGRKMNRLPGHVRKSSGTMKDTLNWTKLNAILTSSFFIFSLFFTISTMNVVARCYRHFCFLHHQFSNWIDIRYPS